jgi:hypothetical protein
MQGPRQRLGTAPADLIEAYYAEAKQEQGQTAAAASGNSRKPAPKRTFEQFVRCPEVFILCILSGCRVLLLDMR